MKFFLTGGTGFLGSYFLQQVLSDGHTVLAHRRSFSSRPKIPILCEPEWLDREFNQITSSDLFGCDILVHLMAHSVSYPFDNLPNCLNYNLIQVLDLFEKARLAGISHFLVAGSCFEYGTSGERFDFIPTHAPLEPTNSYAVSKAAASIALKQWANQHSLNVEILRIFHIFGEGEALSRFWPSLKLSAVAGHDFPMSLGEQIRDFIQVDHVATVFLNRALIMVSSSPSFALFNVGSGRPQSLISFAEFWWSKWNAKGNLLPGLIPYREDECFRYVAGPTLLIAE